MSEYREDILDKLESYFRDFREVRRSVIFGHPGFSIMSRVFCFVYEDGITLKLHPQEYAAILALDEAEKFAPNGSPMGTWAVLTYPDADDYLLNLQWLEKAMSYIVTDEAVPPKKKRKSKGK